MANSVTLRAFPNRSREFAGTCRDCREPLFKGEGQMQPRSGRKRMVCRDRDGCEARQAVWRKQRVQVPDMFADWPEGAAICQDDYEYATSTGQYAGDGWAEYMERHHCPRCGSLNHGPCYGLDITARECRDCGECYSAEE